jgi:hypothetical protein
MSSRRISMIPSAAPQPTPNADGLSTFPIPTPLPRHRRIFSSSAAYTTLRLLLRFAIATSAFAIGIMVPDFNSILAFIGSFFSFSVSAIFPCWVYLRIFDGRIGRWEVIMIKMLLVFSVWMVVVGVVWAPIVDFILKHMDP